MGPSRRNIGEVRMVTTPPLAILFALLGSTLAQSCDPSIYVEKIHSWNKGYTGKMYLDQGWLNQQTSDSVFWRLTATFQNEVKEFKVGTLTSSTPAQLMETSTSTMSPALRY